MKNHLLDNLLKQESENTVLKLSYIRIILILALLFISVYFYLYWGKAYQSNIFYYVSILSWVYLLYAILVNFLYSKKNTFIDFFVPFIDFFYIVLAYLIADKIYAWYNISIFFIPIILLVVLLWWLSFRNYYIYVFSSLSLFLFYFLFSRDGLMFVESIFIWVPIVLIYILSFNISHKFYNIFNLLKKRELLDRFFDEWLIDKIETNPSLLSLSWESKDVVIMFLDIRWFTSISENSSPVEVFNMLNEYLWSFSEIVSKNNWMVDKYIWDCIMAVFWVVSKGDYMKDSYNSALQIIEKLNEINIQKINEWKKTVSIWIWLHKWTVIAGTIGHEKRMDYTVIWDPVNAASRIEALTRKTWDLVLFSKDFVDSFSVSGIFVSRWVFALKWKVNEMELFALK